MENKYTSFDAELKEFQENIPFFGSFTSREGLIMRYMVISLRTCLSFGGGAIYPQKEKQKIENALPMMRAKIQQANGDVDHAWFFNKNEARQKRDILVKLYNYMVYALDLITKSE